MRRFCDDDDWPTVPRLAEGDERMVARFAWNALTAILRGEDLLTGFFAKWAFHYVLASEAWNPSEAAQGSTGRADMGPARPACAGAKVWR